MSTSKDKFSDLSNNYSAIRDTSKIMSQMRALRNLSKKNLKYEAFFQRVTEFGNLFVDNSNYIILVRSSLHEKCVLPSELNNNMGKENEVKVIGVDGRILAGLFKFYPELSDTWLNLLKLRASHIVFLRDKSVFLALLQKLLALESSPNFFGSVMMIRDASITYYMLGDEASKRLKDFYKAVPPYGVVVGRIIRLIQQSPVRFTSLMKNRRINLKMRNSALFVKYLNLFDKR